MVLSGVGGLWSYTQTNSKRWFTTSFLEGGRCRKAMLGVWYPDCGTVWHGQSVVMYPDCGSVWHGQSSVCASPSYVPRLWFCLAWVVFSVCQPYSRTQTVVLSGMGSLQCVPALVMYPDCGPVWHGQSSVCASPGHVPRLWSCLAWAVFSVCQP